MALVVAEGAVLEAGVPAHVVEGVGDVDRPPGPADHHRQLALVVEDVAGRRAHERRAGGHERGAVPREERRVLGDDPGGRLGPVVVVVEPDTEDASRCRHREVERHVVQRDARGGIGRGADRRVVGRPQQLGHPGPAAGGGQVVEVVAPDHPEDGLAAVVACDQSHASSLVLWALAGGCRSGEQHHAGTPSSANAPVRRPARSGVQLSGVSWV